jgi:hypothetical protein
VTEAVEIFFAFDLQTSVVGLFFFAIALFDSLEYYPYAEPHEKSIPLSSLFICEITKPQIETTVESR